MDENKGRLISETESALSHSDFNWNEQTLFMGTWVTQIQMNETSVKFWLRNWKRKRELCFTFSLYAFLWEETRYNIKCRHLSGGQKHLIVKGAIINSVETEQIAKQSTSREQIYW